MKKFLWIAIGCLVSGGSGLAFLVMQWHGWVGKEQTMIDQYRSGVVLSSQSLLSTTGRQELFLYLSGLSFSGIKEEDRLLYNISQGLIETYNWGLEDEVTGIQHAIQTLDQVDEWLDDAKLLVQNKEKYDILQQNALTAQSLRIITTVKLCFAGIKQAREVARATVHFLDRLNTRMIKVLRGILQWYVTADSKELQDCLQKTATQWKDNKKVLDDYRHYFTSVDTQLVQEYHTTLQNPAICLDKKTLYVDVDMKDYVPSDLVHLFTSYAAIEQIIDARDSAMMLEMCAHQGDKVDLPDPSQQLQHTQKQMEQIKNNAKKSKEGSEKTEKNSSSKSQGDRGKGGNKASDRKRFERLDTFEQSVLDGIQQEGEQRYQKTQNLLKQPGYSSYDEIKRVYREFYGYDKDFKDDDQMRKQEQGQ